LNSPIKSRQQEILGGGVTMTPIICPTKPFGEEVEMAIRSRAVLIALLLDIRYRDVFGEHYRRAVIGYGPDGFEFHQNETD
jgi:hypothetical protein